MVPGGEHITNSNRTPAAGLKLYFMVDLFCGLHPLKTQSIVRRQLKKSVSCIVNRNAPRVSIIYNDNSNYHINKIYIYLYYSGNELLLQAIAFSYVIMSYADLLSSFITLEMASRPEGESSGLIFSYYCSRNFSRNCGCEAAGDRQITLLLPPARLPPLVHKNRPVRNIPGKAHFVVTITIVRFSCAS